MAKNSWMTGVITLQMVAWLKMELNLHGILGGGFKHVLFFLPLPGEIIQFDSYFFKGGFVQPPPSNRMWIVVFFLLVDTIEKRTLSIAHRIYVWHRLIVSHCGHLEALDALLGDDHPVPQEDELCFVKITVESRHYIWSNYSDLTRPGLPKGS